MGNNNNQTQLTVYIRAGCHLCDALLEELEKFCSKQPFIYETIEISNDDELEKRYGTKVPVVEYNGTTLCEYFLDIDAINVYFGQSIN